MVLSPTVAMSVREVEELEFVSLADTLLRKPQFGNGPRASEQPINISHAVFSGLFSFTLKARTVPLRTSIPVALPVQ